ncbi:MAG: hypothetical protein WEB67_04665 [Acidimicrobiia bacterium]
MESTLDQVREELAAIHDELLVLPVDDFKGRSALKDRQQELRQLSHVMAEGLPMHNKEILVAEFKRLHQVRDRLLEERLSVTGEGVGDAGIDNMFINAVNAAIAAGAGLDEVEKRINEIIVQMKSAR